MSGQLAKLGGKNLFNNLAQLTLFGNSGFKLAPGWIKIKNTGRDPNLRV
jgi:hypothetical protein